MDATAARPAQRGAFDRLLPATRPGAVRLSLLVHVAVFALATAAGLDYHGDDAGLGVWLRWDTTHYVRIAGVGYPPPDAEGGPLLSAFLPLYPLLVRGLSFATGSTLLAALLLSAGGAVVASAALFEIVSRDAGPAMARRAVAWLNLYPTSFFLVAGYTEAVFLALVLASFLAAREDRFVAASLAAAAAGAARITGVAVLPALALEAWLVSRERRDGAWLRRALPVLLIAPLGVVAYLAMNFQLYGNPLEFLSHQATHWQHVPSTPWAELRLALAAVRLEPFGMDRAVLADALAATIVVVAAAMAYALLRLRPSYALYAMASGWLATAVTWNISAPRYAIAVWPMFWMLAAASRRPVAALVLGGASGAALGVVAVRFMTDLWAF